MHPYPPIQDSAPFSKPFQWPQAGAANLDRIKQALWDAFNGTAQPVPAEQAGGQGGEVGSAGTGLPINLDEVGEQTVVTGHEGAYDAPPENVVPITEQQQAASHVQLAEIAACDPDVDSLLYFPLIDDTSLSGGFQSGNLFADLAHKASYGGREGEDRGGDGASARAASRGSPAAGPTPRRWSAPRGSSADPARRPARGRRASRRPRRASGRASRSVRTRATRRRLVKVPGGPVGPAVTGVVKAYYRPGVHFGNLRLPPGTYQFQFDLTALTNPARTSDAHLPGVHRRSRAGRPPRPPGRHPLAGALPPRARPRQARLRREISSPLTTRTRVR